MGFSKLFTAFKSKDSNTANTLQNEKRSAMANANAGRSPVSNLYAIEPLEPRLLLSADFALPVTDGNTEKEDIQPEAIIQQLETNVGAGIVDSEKNTSNSKVNLETRSTVEW